MTIPPAYLELQRRRLEAFATGDEEPDEASSLPPPPARGQVIPLPGTPQRKALLHERAQSGQELHQVGDVITAPDQHANYRRLRNGHDKIDQLAGTAPSRPEPLEKPSHLRDRKTSTKQMHELICPGLKALGERLRALRGRRSLGQIALASGVPKQTLSRLEAAQTPLPRVDTLLLLADHYRVTLDELVGRRMR